MTPQELKNSILQLAIQGRLVEQRPEEGTAQELYQQIQAEKKRLIKEGKIKKEKPLPEITEDEKPFEIPESWMWVRLNSIALINPKNELDGKLETSFIPMALLADGYRSSYTYEIRCWKDIKKGFTHFAAGDIGIAKITPCFQNRKSAIFTELKNGYGAGTTELSIVRVIGNTISREFLLWFFKSAYFIENGVKSFTGTAGQQRINKDYLLHCVLPLPPLAEQKRIVAKIEELLPLVNRYETAWTRLENFNRRFPEDMKKSILQQAIQGKLVEQRPEEGAAQELYQQIRAEKQRLIKEGKIKKEKPLPEIAEDEKPFDIPEGWMWVRLNYIAESIVDCPHSTPKYLNMETEYCTIDTNCINEKGNITKWRYIDANTYIARIARLAPQKDDIIYTREGSICRAAILPKGKKICLGQRVMLIRCAGGIFPQFLRRMLMTPMVISKLTEQQKGIGAKHVNVSDVCNLVLPLPPLAEQKRIVARLEELLPLCERLKS